MNPKPHFTRQSSDSLRDFAERRRIMAKEMELEAFHFRNSAERHLKAAREAQRKADNDFNIARSKEISKDEALRAAAEADAKADELEGVSELKEAAQ